MKKYIHGFFLIVIAMHVNLLQASVGRIFESRQTAYKQPVYNKSASRKANSKLHNEYVSNTVEQRLAALAENKAKHAQIRQETKDGRHPSGTNFEKISAQKQAAIDKKSQDYFVDSWLQSSGKDASGVQNQKGIEFFQKNKPMIKENYRLANKLANVQTRQNTLQDAAQIRLSSSPLDLISTGKQVFNLGSNKGSQTPVGQNYHNDAPIGHTYYKNIKNPTTNQYEVKRSGISNQDVFVPENGNETMQQYADRYTAANNAIKPKNSVELISKLQQENSALANTVIPDTQSIGPSRMFSLGNSLLSNYSGVKSLYVNTQGLYNKGMKAYNNYDSSKGVVSNIADVYSS